MKLCEGRCTSERPDLWHRDRGMDREEELGEEKTVVGVRGEANVWEEERLFSQRAQTDLRQSSG